MICHQCEMAAEQVKVEFLDFPNQGEGFVFNFGVVRLHFCKGMHS